MNYGFVPPIIACFALRSFFDVDNYIGMISLSLLSIKFQLKFLQNVFF